MTTYYTFQQLLNCKIVNDLDDDKHTDVKEKYQVTLHNVNEGTDICNEFFIDEDGVNIEDSNGEGEVLEIVDINEEVFSVNEIINY